MVRLLLVGSLAAGSGCSGNPAALDPGDLLPVYGECSAAPNYISQVQLTRHRSFPVSVANSGSGGWDSLEPAFERGIMDGLGRWETGQLGRLVLTDSIQAAIRIHDEALPPDTTDVHPPLAGTFTTTVDGLIQTAVVTFYRFSWRGVLTDHAEGLVTDTALEDFIAAVTAHELGHALGIEGHPSGEGLLMSSAADVYDYVGHPTTADRNTMAHAYCGSPSQS